MKTKGNCDWLNRVGGWVVRGQVVGRGWWAVCRGSWVVGSGRGRVCLKVSKRYINIY